MADTPPEGADHALSANRRPVRSAQAPHGPDRDGGRHAVQSRIALRALRDFVYIATPAPATNRLSTTNSALPAAPATTSPAPCPGRANRPGSRPG